MFGVGAGKGGFINSTAYKGKFYFGRTPILDYRPAKAFGYYQFFNTKNFVDMLEEMTTVAKGEVQEEVKKTKGGEIRSQVLEEIVHEWVETEGQVMFQHSVLVLDEFKRYMDKRRPHKPIGLMLSDLFTLWRHLDLLVLAATTYRDYLDFRAFLEMTTEARCIWLGKMRTLINLHPIKRVSADGVVEKEQYWLPYLLNLGKPQEILEGLAYKDLFNTRNLVAMQVPTSMKREG